MRHQPKVLVQFLSLIFLLTSPLMAQEISFNKVANYSGTPVGTTKRETINLRNTSRDQVRLDSYWFHKTDSYNVVGGTCKFGSTVLKRNGSCSVIIEFKPTWSGNHDDQFTAGYFLGKGWSWSESHAQVVGSTDIAAFENDLNFNDLELGQSLKKSVTVHNSSSTQIRLDSHWFNMTDSYQVVGGSCGTGGYILKAGQRCHFEIQYQPTWQGNHQDRFTLGFFVGTGWTWVEINADIQGTASNQPIAVEPPPPVQEPTPTSDWLRVVGNKIVNAQDETVILKGVNIADPQHLDTKPWERPGVTARSIASLATDEYHARVVRLPILPGDPKYPNEGFFSPTNGKQAYFDKHIAPLVEELTNKGIYVIIDLHYISDYQNLYPKVHEFWEFMAPKFSNNPRVLYEIFNEPILPNNWDTWKNTIAQPIVNLIRQQAPHNLVLVGGPYWSSNILGAATNPVEGTNIVYVAHIYSNQTPKMWDDRYLPVMKKHPVFITEWGFEEHGTEGGTINFGQSFEEWMSKHGLSWTVWNFDNRWGPRMFNQDWTLIDESQGMGTFVRDLLYENAHPAPVPLVLP